MDAFKDKRVLVTGGSGLIGRKIVGILASGGAKVTSVSLDDIELRDDVEYQYADLRHFHTALELTSGVDFVFHLAGIKGSVDVTKEKPASFLVPMLQFNTNVLEACRQNEVKGVLYTSSIGAYKSGEVFVEDGNITNGEPMDMFPGWAKRMAELQIKAYKTQYGLKNFVAVRPCNVYGEGDNFDPNNAMVIPSLIYKAVTGNERPVRIWGDGSAVRDFAYSGDVARGCILAMYHQPQTEFLNLSSGDGITIRSLVETLNEVHPFEYEWDTTKPSGFPRRIMSIQSARELIGYEPATTLKEGLTRTIHWFKENQDEYLQRQNYFTEKS